MKYPNVSIIIATHNSAGTLPKTLASIKRQTYPQNKIEVLIVDGKSKDQTREIAKEFGYKVIDNPGIGFIPGKNIGFIKSQGDFAMYLDSDEELYNPDSLKIKISTFSSNSKIKGAISTGYKSPQNYPDINQYINELGDPFSFFIYRSSINSKFFLKKILEKYKKYKEDKEAIVFDFSKSKPLPLIELVAMGCMVDLKYLKKEFPQIKNKPNLVPHLFYLLNSKKALFAIIKNDPIIHYSADTFSRYLKKIAWRIRNNIYNKQGMGTAGFEGRDKFQPFTSQLKKYLFIPYSFSLIFPLIDSIYLTVTRRDTIFLLHPFLCIFTSYLIIYYFTLKIFGLKPKMQSYGN